jgi:hypothetical protein
MQVSATGAEPGRRKAPRDHDEGSSVPSRFVLQHPQEGSPPHVGHGPGERAPGEAFDVQVLHHDDRLGPRQPGGEPVQEVPAEVLHLAVKPRQSQGGFFLLVGALLLAGELLGPPLEEPEPLGQRLGGLYPGAIGKDGEGRKAQINTHYVIFVLHLLRLGFGAFHLAGEAHVPAVGLPGNGSGEDAGLLGLDEPDQLVGSLLGPDQSDPGELDLPGEDLDDPREAGLVVVQAFLALEPWEPGPLGLPVLQGLLQVPKSFLGGALGDLGPPGGVLPLPPVPLPVELGGRGESPSLFKGLLAEGKAPVVGEAGRPYVLDQGLALGGVGGEFKAEGLVHPHMASKILLARSLAECLS